VICHFPGPPFSSQSLDRFPYAVGRALLCSLCWPGGCYREVNWLYYTWWHRLYCTVWVNISTYRCSSIHGIDVFDHGVSSAISLITSYRTDSQVSRSRESSLTLLMILIEFYSKYFSVSAGNTVYVSFIRQVSAAADRPARCRGSAHAKYSVLYRIIMAIKPFLLLGLAAGYRSRRWVWSTVVRRPSRWQHIPR